MGRRAVYSLPLAAFALFSLTAALDSGPAYADIPTPQVEPPPVNPVRKAPAAKPSAKPVESAAPSPSPTAVADDTVAADEPLTEEEKVLGAIQWQKGPTKGELGEMAEIDVPEGYLFTDGEGTRKFLEFNKNPTNGSELGLIIAPGGWALTFEFSDIGYVKDDEKAELDADEILKALREGNEGGNEVRRTRGWNTVSIVGWEQPPRYDQLTNNLEWSMKVQNDVTSHVTVNHNIRILGRGGVMETNLMASPEEYGTALPDAKKVLESYQFKAGQRYSEWKQGDRIAAIGLTGLITGGAIAAAAKSGLLGKVGVGIAKLFAVGGKAIIAIGAALAAGLAKLFGRSKDKEQL